MGTAESANTRKSIKKVAYSVGPAPHQTIPDDYILISADTLTQAFVEGALRFIEEIMRNPEKLALAERKAEKYYFFG